MIPPKPVTAVADMTLTFDAGEVVGIAGPNGAGKSTLISLVLGLLNPTAGTVAIDGQRPRRFVERHGIAYVPELIAIPPWWRVTGALSRYAVLSGVPREERKARVEKAIDALGLEEHRGKRVKQLSKGNRQRLGIAQALLSDARVVVFDEPTHGLDPVWTSRFRDLVRDLRRPDRCIIIASHNLHELARVAPRLAILDRGAPTTPADPRRAATPPGCRTPGAHGTSPTCRPWPRPRMARPMAAVDLPWPLPVWTMIRPRSSVLDARILLRAARRFFIFSAWRSSSSFSVISAIFLVSYRTSTMP